MTLGKRQRPLMRRTTSVKEISDETLQLQVSVQEFHAKNGRQRSVTTPAWLVGEGKTEVLSSGHVGKKTQKSRRPTSLDGVSKNGLVTASFLRACGLCKRGLGPGKDTFMYRGEIGFCSLECRQHQMALDERKDKCSSPTAATT